MRPVTLLPHAADIGVWRLAFEYSSSDDMLPRVLDLMTWRKNDMATCSCILEENGEEEYTSCETEFWYNEDVGCDERNVPVEELSFCTDSTL
jgi:hypothetical protein